MAYRRLVCAVGVAILLLLWFGYGSAQDEIPSPAPEPSLSPTLEPSIIPMPTETVEATVTALPSDTIEPTLEVLPSETPIAQVTDEWSGEPTLTVTPSETAVESPTEEAPFTPVEDVTEEPVETSIPLDTPPTATLVQDLPPEPAMAVRVSENFDSGDLAGWRFAAAGWALVPHNEGLALQVFNSEGPANLVQPDFLNVAAQAEVLLDYGGARLEVRRSVVGSYAATLDAAGQVNLYRAGTLLMVAQVAPSLPGQWRTLRLSAVNGALRVRVDDLDVIVTPDTAPLPPGMVSLSGMFTLDSEVQLPQNTLQVDDFMLFVPEAELPPPTPTTLPTPTQPDLAIPAPQAESNGIFVVNMVEDVIDGECSELHCSLREAIIAANAYGGGAIVTIPSGTYKLSIAGSSEDESQTGDLDITASMTIQGAGANQTIIDADGLDRVFDVRYADGTFSDLTITGGYAYTDFQNGDGGGLRVNDSSVTLTNVIIEHNTALTYRGGGVSINSGPVPKILTLDHSLIRDNTADVGGGLYLSGANALITETTISGNTSASSLGGGIFVSRMWDDPVDGVHLSGVTISGNSAIQGGGVYAAGTAVLSIVNSTISGNHADEAGGGLVTTTYAETTLNNVTITQNTVDQDGSDHDLGGGGIYTGFYYELIQTIGLRSDDSAS